MEETQKGSCGSAHLTDHVQVTREATIEAETIFKAALNKLGSIEHKIQFATTPDQKHYAILTVEINCYQYTEYPKRADFYSYFHDTIKDAREDVYSEAVDWLKSEFNLIVDIKANDKLKEAEKKLRISNTMASIIVERYIKATNVTNFVSSDES